MRRLVSLAAALFAVFPGIAGAAQPPCLTPREFAAVAQFALPAMITGATQRCATVLPRDSYLRNEGAGLAARYATGTQASWPVARAAFLKLSTSADKDSSQMLQAMPDASLQQMASAMVEGLVSGRLPLDRCKQVDTVLRLLAPLPARDTAELIATLVGLVADAKPGKLGPLSVCPA